MIFTLSASTASWTSWDRLTRTTLCGVLVLFHILTLDAQDARGTAGFRPSGSNGTTRAVVVGISDYQHPDIPDLQFADRDAEAFASWLVSPDGKNLSPENVRLLLNNEAVASQVLKEMIWLVEESEPGDEAYLYFSGHGDVQRSFGGDGYLLCHDAIPVLYAAGGAISIHHLKTSLDLLAQEKHVRVSVFLDACHAGKLEGSILGGPQLTLNTMARELESVTKFMACQPTEVSLESEQWGGGHGVFTYFLIRGLSGEADEDKDGLVSLYETRRYLEENIKREASPVLQHPSVTGEPEAIIHAYIPNPPSIAIENTKSSIQRFESISGKSYTDWILENTDSTTAPLIIAFLHSLSQKNYFDKSDCADSLYFKIIESPSCPKKTQRFLTREYAAALQSGTQRILMGMMEMESNIIFASQDQLPEISLAPKYLARSVELLGPNHWLTQELLGRISLFEGMALYQQTIELRDSASAAQIKLYLDKSLTYIHDFPIALYMKMKCLLIKQGEPEAARQVYDKLLHVAPSWTLPGAILAFELSKTYHRFQEAAEIIQTGFRSDSTSIAMYTALGGLYTYLPNIGKAIQTFETVVSLDSTNAMGWSNLGSSYILKSRWTEAESSLRRSLSIRPTLAQSHVNLGALYRIQGRLVEAEESYKKALAISPHRMVAIDSLSALYQATGRQSEALALADTILSFRPNDPAALYRKAFVYLDLGNLNLAVEFLRQAVNSDPGQIPFIRKEPKWMKLPDIETLLTEKSSKHE